MAIFERYIDQARRVLGFDTHWSQKELIKAEKRLHRKPTFKPEDLAQWLRATCTARVFLGKEIPDNKLVEAVMEDPHHPRAALDFLRHEIQEVDQEPLSLDRARRLELLERMRDDAYNKVVMNSLKSRELGFAESFRPHKVSVLNFN